MYFKLITFQNVTGPTPNHLLWDHHTPDLHQGTAKAHFLIQGVFVDKISPIVSPTLY